MSDIGIIIPPWMILLILGYDYWWVVLVVAFALGGIGLMLKGWARTVLFFIAGLLVLALGGDVVFWLAAPK